MSVAVNMRTPGFFIFCKKRKAFMLFLLVVSVAVFYVTVSSLEVSSHIALGSITSALRFSDSRESTRLSPSALNPEDVLRFTKRWETVQNACRLHINSPSLQRRFRLRIRLPFHPPIMNVSVSYCPIPKTSSTTWKEILNAIRKKTKSDTQDIKSLKESKHKHVTFMFVREPYSRLLSAYVDKLFSPNTIYWKLHGKYIVRNFRPNSTWITCGHDVTFPEFIKYFIHMEKTRQHQDRHFIPMYRLCPVCSWPHAYIGQLETVSEDMPFILKEIQSPVAYERDFESHNIGANARRDLTGGALRCISIDTACRRIWKKWHVRGHISKTQVFPLKQEQTRVSFNITDFITAALTAQAHSGERRFRVGQKKEALKEAYAQVSLEDRLEVKKLLSMDFELFGFDPEPEEVFPKVPFIPDPNFSYFDLYK
ncbi:uncharacterized protein LOC143290819 [Babylonia areolata]|uniref:uncharacterized protein LOC143290819 n=1 Tax=Babylonia areolata TaxID=304850 RepID=UPI003FD0C60A